MSSKKHYSKIWSFDLDTGTRQLKTWVYSDTGTDIEERFKGYKVTNIKELQTEIPEDNDNSRP